MEETLQPNGKKYVYDKYEKNFYVDRGIKMIDSRIHFKTKKQFWIFDWNDIESAFNDWKNKINM